MLSPRVDAQDIISFKLGVGHLTKLLVGYAEKKRITNRSHKTDSIRPGGTTHHKKAKLKSVMPCLVSLLPAHS